MKLVELVTVLNGHESPQTAYVVEDYPYGFKLRCKKRYWREWKNGNGFRLMEQTTNPKKFDIWNKPKASTYNDIMLLIGLDEVGHVNAAVLHAYHDLEDCKAFEARYKDQMSESDHKRVLDWIEAKERAAAASAARKQARDALAVTA